MMSKVVGALAALTILIATPTAAAAASAPDLVVNGSFEQFSGANPDSWSRWTPSGTGSVAAVPGESGGTAAQITTDTTSSRLALVQSVAVSAGIYRLDFRYALSGMSGTGTAGIRVNVGSQPAVFPGSARNTDGWVSNGAWINVPAGESKATLHLFNDKVKGSMMIDDVRFVRSDATDYATAMLTASGDVGIDWEVNDATGVDHYDIYRTDGATIDVATAELLRTVPATVTAASDQDWMPAAQYTYVVIGRDAAGAELVRTVPVTITAPAESNIHRSSLAALQTSDGVHLSWAAGREENGPFALYAASESLADGDVTNATRLADDVSFAGASEVDSDATHFALTSGGTVIATASVAGTGHPRIMLNDEVLAKVDRLITEPGTPQQLFQTITQRVDGGQAASGTSPDRYAREAAFLFQVTGEQRYADLAYEAFQLAAERTPFGKSNPLETANPTSQLALTYDWAYDGWTDAQRTAARDYFERSAAFLEMADHPNMVWDDKGSNWVGVTRGAELAAHLAVRGDADYGYRDARIARLLDQLVRHAEQGYTDAGWYQEGLDYLDYDNMIAVTGVLGSFDAGIDALREPWYAPGTADLLLHADSLRDGPGSSLQWGVGTGGHAAWPLYLDRAVDDGVADRAAAMFERVQGHLSQKPWYSPAHSLYTFVYWPEDGTDLRSDEVLPALFDDEAGVAMFRNRIQDADDVLIGLGNRNHDHLGWGGFDTLGLSLIANDTMWASQPGKDQNNAAKYSRVLVDGAARQAEGRGKTLAAAGYENQGGGYVSFDSAGNLGVQQATREAVVDMTARSSADTVMVTSDSFADSTSHRWTWQLAPQAGVTAEIGDVVDGARQVTLHNGDAWMRMWLLDAEGAEVTFTGGVLRMVREGTTADFDIVTALGSGAELPAAQVNGDIVEVDGFVADVSDLVGFTPVSAAAAWTADTRYQAGDQVSVDGHLFEALRPTTADEPAVKVRGPWQEIREAGDTLLWTPTRVFAEGDVVLYEGAFYTATDKTRVAEPGTPDAPWTPAL